MAAALTFVASTPPSQTTAATWTTIPLVSGLFAFADKSDCELVVTSDEIRCWKSLHSDVFTGIFCDSLLFFRSQ